ncbi:TPA: DUF1270 domain-containing protein [Staphylococcus aureus]|nr:DUF1270 domain-containing protein [Staphylococcus aureus]HCU6907388.1 DUF1270 domain-containing protein [Staphylococcus aureus]HCU9590135.1 DUF1270 domain-containing protein [Staphylococcus aureus]HCV0309794.1 DUF1270 domain-containing protein [Staphylococcus aureus]HCV1081930.1 DUF1270 domain-containing protein [Staphylococcus aureus]
MSDTYKSYLLAVLCFTVLAIVLMPFLYFTTAWSIAGFASIATFIFIRNTFMKNKETATCWSK